MYILLFSKQAKKFLVNLEKKEFNSLKLKIQQLSLEPIPRNSKKLVDVQPPTFRIRYSKFRVLYVVNLEKTEIFISKIDKRSKVYKQ